nr:hypothetical protein [Tanacetum cinerariifolium]
KRLGDVTSLQALVDKKKIVISEVLAQRDNVQEPTVEDVVPKVVPPTPTSSSPPSSVIPSLPPHQPPCPPQPQDAEGSSLLFQQVLATCSALALRVEDDMENVFNQGWIIADTDQDEGIELLRRLNKVGTSQRVESLDDMEIVFNQGRIIVDMDQDEGIELVADQEKDAEFKGRHADKQAEIYNIDLDHSFKVLSMQEDDTEVQKDVEIVTTAKLMTEVVIAAATQVAATSTPIPAAKPKILTITAASAVSTRRRKRVVLRDPEEDLPSDTPAETPKVKDKGKGILIEAPKPMKKKDQIEMDAEYHGMKKKPQTKSEARKNMIFYLKNTEGYKMDFFKGKKYDEILPIFQAKFDANIRFLFKSKEEMEAEDEEIIKSINETPAQKAAKRRKLSEEAQEAKDLRKRLEIKQTAFGKDISNPFMADNLPKIIWFSTHHVTFMKSWLVQKQTAFELASQKQTALGKDISNSLIVDSLLKTIWFLIHHHLTIEVLAIPGQTATVNPHIYISCIKQFWNTASVKRLGDADGVVCLPNEEIFAGLAQMGYKKPTSWNEFSTAMASAVICLSKGQKFNFSKYIFDSLVRNVDSSSKFYMYPRFIQLIIQNQVGDLSTHTTRFISPALTQKVFANMRRVGKGFLGVETPLFEGMLAVRQSAEEGIAEAQVWADDAIAAAVEENVAEDVPHDAVPSPPFHDIPSPLQEHSSPPQQPQKIIKLQARVKRLEKANQVKSLKLRRLRKVGASRRVDSSDDMDDVFNQGRMINDMDKDKGIELVKDANVAETEGRHVAEQAEKQAEIYNLDLDHSSKVLSMKEDDSEVQEVVEVVTTAKLITDVVTAASQVSAASATIFAAKPSIPAAALTVVAAYTRRRKGVIIRDPKEELSLKTPAETPKKLHEEINKDHEEFNKDIDWDAAMDHVNQKSKNPQYIKRYQGMKKRPQTESEAHKNIMIYLKNIAGYKMDFFKGMMYAEICLIFQARFDENMRFLFKSREEMEEDDQEIIKA